MADDWNIEPLDRRRVCQKRRRSAGREPQPLDALPAEWYELLARWARRGGNSRWETLRKDAGANRVQLADTLLDWLLRNGWAAAVEHWQVGAWWPQQVELLHLPRLRAALGMPDTATLARDWENLRASLVQSSDPAMAQAMDNLDSMPAARAVARGELLAALGRWRTEQRNGTRRDFSLFARGMTKAVSDAEWRWLEENLDLADFGIERHTPFLLIAAPLVFDTAGGHVDLCAFPDFAALTPQTVAIATKAQHRIARWRLIENRTSFERAAKNRESDIGLIWLPGFPPGWWRETVGLLLALAPAPAEIACDPDPAGVAIAMQAGGLWDSFGLDWQPWKMTASDLLSLPTTQPLTDWDRQCIGQIDRQDMKPELADLLDFMLQHNLKGEQEGAI